MGDNNELTSWQEIADHLRVSVRTAQNYEKQARLPIRRMPGARGRVIAYGEDLDRWKAAQLALSRSPQNEGVREPGEQEPGKRTPTDEVVSNVATAVPAAALFPTQEVPKKTSSRRAFAGTASAIAVLGILIVFGRSVWHAGQPVAFRTEVSTLIAVDGQGQEVWRHQFPKPFSEYHYKSPFNKRTCTFADLDGDGQMDMLFPYFPVDWGSASTTLFCFSPDGKERWRFVPGRPVVTDATGDRYFPPYHISGVQVIQNQREHLPRIVVSSNHHMQAPDQVAVLSNAGKLIGEYWHPGHLLHMTHADLDRDGKEELLIAGVNNGFHAATLLVFDPANVTGTSLHLRDSPLQIQGFGPGTQKAVVMFPRMCVGRIEPYNRVREIKVVNNRVYVAVVEGVSEANPRTILYELDFQLNVLSASPSVELQAAHREMERSQELDHVLSAEDVERWKKAVIVFRDHIPSPAAPK